ncbi:hypothetical protein IC230_32340 [Spirosoma sp. BT704]|uniref:Peptidase S74 domain-containing protein n=2 Tax=Spirosoma validum TaxID=2771355 RepID=A0A927B8V2_9BACT|nr:hypothetical protein [Spirosoma validum]
MPHRTHTDRETPLLGANASNYTNGSNNTSLGFNAGGWFLSGSQNVFIGTNAASYFRSSDIYGSTTRTLTGNCFLGYQAGTYNQADHNVFIGYQSGFTNVTGIRNVFVGASTGYANTGGDNAFLGYQAGQTNTTGTNNTFLGSLAGQSNTSGQFNSFVGSYTGQANTTGGLNTFMGYGTGMSNTSGRVNTFLGGYAGESNTTGIQNTYVGYQAGQATTTGNTNTILGYQAGSKLTTGHNNIIIGPKSGTAVTDGSDNVLMGYNSQAEEGIFNAIAIGSHSRVATSNALILGNRVNVGIGTSAPHRKLEVVADEADQSGLRLSKLTSQSQLRMTTDQFLTVNDQGDVVKARYRLRINSPIEWSDQVFSPTYPLRSLPSVASYIAQYGHLPNVPSAEEVVSEGVDLVKMNATLLEKVEELTLYSIEQDKKARNQDERINQLERLVKQLLLKK